MSKIVDLIVPEPEVPLPQIDLVETDGLPLESSWHQAAISLLLDIVTCYLRQRDDFYVAGNMFIYYSVDQARKLYYRGPDFFFVNGVKRYPPRRWWAVWDEGGRYPDVIIELLSRSTAKLDRTVKKELHEGTFHTPDYYCYDPASSTIEGWRLLNGRYQPITPNENGWLWCQEMNLWLGN